MHKEEVNNKLIGTKNVKREVHPFKRIVCSIYHLLKIKKKNLRSARTEYLPISSILRRALLHFNISDI